jgi:outer membrane protein assembly factor BamB
VARTAWTKDGWRPLAADDAQGCAKIKRHLKATHANSTLATDGERLIAFFGSEGLYAYDMKGKLLWKKDLGVLDAGWFTDPSYQWETGSSPIIHNDVVVVQADVLKGSFIAAFSAPDGRELWRTARNEVPTWGTPTVHQVNGREQLIVNGWHHIGAYDFKTGKEIWKLKGGGDIPIPTPVVHEGLIYITNAHGPIAPVYAIRETATGEITPPAGATRPKDIAWSSVKDGGYMSTPIVYRGPVYIVKLNGGLTVTTRRRANGRFSSVSRPVLSHRHLWHPTEAVFPERRGSRPCLEGRPHVRASVGQRHGREHSRLSGDL